MTTEERENAQCQSVYKALLQVLQSETVKSILFDLMWGSETVPQLEDYRLVYAAAVSIYGQQKVDKWFEDEGYEEANEDIKFELTPASERKTSATWRCTWCENEVTTFGNPPRQPYPVNWEDGHVCKEWRQIATHI